MEGCSLLPPTSTRFEGFKYSVLDNESRTGEEILMVPAHEYEDYLDELEKNESEVFENFFKSKPNKSNHGLTVLFRGVKS